MVDTSFIEKLRLANIFPADGSPRQGVPFGMPDMYSGRQPIDPFIQRQLAARSPVSTPNRLQQISRGISKAPSNDYGRGPNIRYDAPESDKIGLRILGPTLAERDIINQKQALPFRKQILAEKVASGKATDSEKHQYALDLEEEKNSGRIGLEGVRQDNRMELQGTRGEQAMSQITGRGTQQRMNTELAGKQRLGQIEATGNQNRLTQENKPITATETGNQQDNTIRQLMITRPELAQYVVQDTGGRITINPEAPLDAVSQINQAIYGRDINLPSSRGTSTSKTPTSKTPTSKPTAAELLKKYSR